MKKLVFLASILLIVFGACAPFSGPLPGVEPPTLYVQHVPSQGEFPYSMDLGSNTKSVYFVFTNPDTERSAPAKPTVTGSGNAKSLTGPSLPPAPLKSMVTSRIAPTPARVTDFNRDPFKAENILPLSLQESLKATPGKPSFDAEGNTGFLDDLGAMTAVTCRRVVGPIPTALGNRTLNIWVADDCWTPAPTKAHAITQQMVNEMADRFLKSLGSNDVFDWVTSIEGAEWASYTYNNVIPFNNEITILLCDIGGDNSDIGGIVGYFWGKDNFKDAYVYSENPLSPTYHVHSNERIMFYIDAVLYANDSSAAGTWSPTGYWPQEIFSSLAHEFQHVVSFHQKVFVSGAGKGSDTWIDEMCSQGMEDLVADKLAVMGPRGVNGLVETAGPANNPEGRIPLFNAYPAVSLSDWGTSDIDALKSYSATYSFGAYLLRNYGGAALLKAMVQSPKTDGGQIVDAVSAFTGRTETLSQIFQCWSAAVLLSDRTDAPAGYRYNTGNFFTSTGGGTSYNLGSINFFNYQQYGGSGTGPLMDSGNGSVGSTTPRAASGTLYSAAIGATGKKDWTIDLPIRVNMSVVVK